MLERLVLASSNSSLRFELFGSHVHATWSRDFESFARTTGVYRGQVSFDQLTMHAQDADMLLLPMGFGENALKPNAQALRQSFLIT